MLSHFLNACFDELKLLVLEIRKMDIEDISIEFLRVLLYNARIKKDVKSESLMMILQFHFSKE